MLGILSAWKNSFGLIPKLQQVFQTARKHKFTIDEEKDGKAKREF